MPHRTLDEYLEQATHTTKQQTTKPKYIITEIYRETEFQETPIGKIPKTWKITKFRSITKINGAKVNITNLEGKIARIPMEFVPDDGIYVKYTLMPINEIRSYVIAGAGDILLAKITPSFENGKQGIVPEDVPHGIALATTEVYSITPINIERLFLFYLLKWHRYRKLLEWKMTGTTGRRRVPRSVLENLLIPLPPLEEQWGIAEVLSTIDKAIEETERLIERLERLKQALMQELLTKGIGHKEFKETAIGKMPKQWKIVKIKDIASITSGFASGKRDENGIIQLRMDSISVYGYIDKNNYVKVPPRQNIEKYYLNSGDILFVNTSGSLEHLGKVALFKAEWDKCVYSNHLTRIRVTSKHVIPEWIYYVLYYRFISGYFRIIKVTQAGGQNNIHLNNLKNMLVPIPPLEEQNQITDMLKSINNWIELERKRRGKFKRLKRGLMSLLLTGKVRVKVERVG